MMSPSNLSETPEYATVHSGWRVFGLGLTALTLAALACNSPFGDSGGEETSEIDLFGDSAEEMTLSEALAVEPDDGRPQTLELMGAPDVFTITFQELEGQVVRWDQWSYLDFESRFDFVDGELVWTIDLEPVPDGSIYAHFYDPMDFEAYMSIAEAKALLSDQELEEIDLTEGDIPGGVILAGDQIVMGFDNDRLVYVETMMLSPVEEGGVALTDATPEGETGEETPAAPPTSEPLISGAIIEDTFDDPSQSPTPLFGSESMSFSLVDGEGQLSGTFEGGVLPAMYANTPVSDFTADFDFRADTAVAGSTVGLLFRADPSGGATFYYHLVIRPVDGVVGIDAWKDGGWALSDQTPLPSGLLSTVGTNNVRLEVVGNQFEVFVNDVSVHTVTDSQIPGAGIFGLSVVPATSPETVYFDNFVVITP